MKNYLAKFETDLDSPFPYMEFDFSLSSDDMAKTYVARLLQAESNTMFHSVQLFEMHEYAGQDDRHIVTYELYTTRGVKEKES